MVKLKEIKEYWDKKEEKLKSHYFTNSKGKIEGEYKLWYNNGQLEEHTSYKNGKREGEYKHWHENGKLWEHTSYKNGEREGEYKEWYENGQLNEHTFWLNENRFNSKELYLKAKEEQYVLELERSFIW